MTDETKPITHVMQTRFNLATPGRENAIRNRPGWLEERFAMFEEICLPSIGAQTCTDFTWIIYFDKDTPPAFKDRIEKLRREVDFVPYYTGLFPQEGWNTSIDDVIPKRTPLILTTRLDNDDALASDYVARAQETAQAHAHQAPLCINFNQGYIRSDSALYAVEHPSNAFFSRLCAWQDDMRPAMSILHMTIAEHGAVLQLDGAAGWLQVIHGGNVSNKIRGRRISADTIEGQFHPDLLNGLPPASSLQLGIDNMLLGPLRNMRDWLLAQRARNKAL